MSFYASAVTEALERLPPMEPGAAVLIVSPGAQAVVAEEAAGQLRDRLLIDDAIPVAPLTPGLLEQAGLVVASGVAAGSDRAVVFRALNGQRDWLTRQKRFVLLVLSADELDALSREAPDLASTFRFVMTIPFVPDPSVSLDAARSSLAGWYDTRFSKLNLRGFIRAENEDVAWRVEDIYQELAAIPRPDASSGAETIVEMKGVPLTGLLQQRLTPGSLAVILGHPGAGKTFYLRWLALKMARGESILGTNHPMPLLVSLAGFAQASAETSLLDHLRDQLLRENVAAAHWVERAVLRGEALLLLDGLDEVSEAARHRVVEAVRRMREQAPGCLTIVTCRVAGYEDDFADARQFTLAAFSEGTVRTFLIRWCELYACERNGDFPRVRAEGRNEGEKLAAEVLGNSQIAALATSPLLLTVLPVVHRAGIRLPAHRVELYSQATRILVERWNRIRGLDLEKPALPIKVADAVRLLGPVALELIRSGSLNEIPEARLRELLARTIKTGGIQGLSTPEDALDLFRDELGLLVEQTPGRYGFLHLTLAEYFAAWELLRTRELEALAKDSKRAFDARWREVLLLAAGELGVMRADDERLDELIGLLLASAASRRGRPSTVVPSVLSGILADDPGLGRKTAQEIVDALIPTWWFNRNYGGSIFEVVLDARMTGDRLLRGRWGELVRCSLSAHYGSGMPEKAYENLKRGKQLSLTFFFGLLSDFRVDYGPALERFGDQMRGLPLWVFVRTLGGAAIRIEVPRSVYDLARRAGSHISLVLSAPVQNTWHPHSRRRVSWPDEIEASSIPGYVAFQVTSDVPKDFDVYVELRLDPGESET